MDFSTLGSLFELSRDAVIGLSQNRIVFANPRAVELFGISPDADAAEVLPKQLLNEEADPFVSKLCISNIYCTVSSRRMEENRLLCFTPSEESSYASAFNFKAVRDMSDSLAEMRMAMDAVMRQCKNTPDARLTGYTAVLYRDYFRLQRLCNHLSTAAGISDGKLPFSPRVVDLKKTISGLCDSVRGFSDELSASIETDIEDGLYYTCADETLLETMLLNILSNSLLHCEKDDSVRITLRQKNSHYIISVNDTGCGMSVESMLHAFDPQKKADLCDSKAGVGLGLIIAQGIAELHDGTLLLENGKSGGCHVRITLPQKDPPELTFKAPMPVDSVGQMNLLLSELSGVLPGEAFIARFLD